jgi:SAM-dependent methyltransferase
MRAAAAGIMHGAAHALESLRMLNRRLMLAAIAAIFAILIGPRLLLWAQRSAAPLKLAPYVTTPQDVVDRMLELAQVGPKDVVYDLGCGDGRLVITAAKTYGARGVGVDFDLDRVRESQENARKAGVESLVEFKQQDALTVDVSAATVVTLYLLSSSNLRLRPILTRTLAPGARIVSHQFDMGDWVPQTKETLTASDGAPHILYLWKTDGRIRP